MAKTRLRLYFLKEGHYLRDMFVGEKDNDDLRPEHDFYEMLKKIDNSEVDRIGDYDLIGLCLLFEVTERSLHGNWTFIYFTGETMGTMKFFDGYFTMKDIEEKGVRQTIIDTLGIQE